MRKSKKSQTQAVALPCIKRREATGEITQNRLGAMPRKGLKKASATKDR